MALFLELKSMQSPVISAEGPTYKQIRHYTFSLFLRTTSYSSTGAHLMSVPFVIWTLEGLNPVTG